MPDLKTALKPVTALGQDEARTITVGPFTITERIDVALGSVAVRRDRAKDLARAAKAADLPLPAPACAQSSASWSAFWMTPEMWMVEAPFATHENITERLKSALGDAASISEQTDAWVRFDITAPQISTLLERLTNLDLGPKPQGFAARTVIDHLGIYLIKRSETEVSLYGPRASAQSLLHAIEVTARSVL